MPEKILSSSSAFVRAFSRFGAGVVAIVCLCAAATGAADTVAGSAATTAADAAAEPIDRHALVTRHNVRSTSRDTLFPLGNGEFAFGVDGTGLQTFRGNILSHAFWHANPLPAGVTPADIPETGTAQRGRCQPGKGEPNVPNRAALDWMHVNQHLANLGRLRLTRADGTVLKGSEIKNVNRLLDLWNGVHTTAYEVDGERVAVETTVTAEGVVHATLDSKLFARKKLKIALDFPYPDHSNANHGVHKQNGDFNAPQKHTTRVLKIAKNTAGGAAGSIILEREADALKYGVAVSITGASFDKDFDKEIAPESNIAAHTVSWISDGSEVIKIALFFSKENDIENAAKKLSTTRAAGAVFPAFWRTGGAIDLSGSTDPRWRELERRVVLSQYLMRACSAGSFPPGESSIVGSDPWLGQFHYEMLWWHLAHYFLWSRPECADAALDVAYNRFKPFAKKLAKQLDYAGYKWGKSCGPDGRTNPWVGNQVLLWKQPHPVFFAHLDYRCRPSPATLEKWADTLEGTATHIADYATRDAAGVYHLNPVMPPSEIGITRDSVFDLAYWRFGLLGANRWRELQGKARNAQWDEIAKNLAPLPVRKVDGETVFTHSAEWRDSITRRNWEHPDLIGVFGMLPPLDAVDQDTARRTVKKVIARWRWTRCWGWDFPWTAMAAARCGEPELALDILLRDTRLNAYPENGINGGWYLPGNGGVLYAVAMLAAGWNGAPARHAPGFPANGKWKVRFENIKPAL